MSQASKQVEWCLSKAKKEIEECKKLGKRAKHRGLLKISLQPYVNVRVTGSNVGEVSKKAEAVLIKTISRRMVINRVERVFNRLGLNLNETLDLHVMNRGLLVPGQYDEERAIAIQQCRDPSFWHTVLEAGRLYDRKSKEFSIPVSVKYPDALGLFKQG